MTSEKYINENYLYDLDWIKNEDNEFVSSDGEYIFNIWKNTIRKKIAEYSKFLFIRIKIGSYIDQEIKYYLMIYNKKDSNILASARITQKFYSKIERKYKKELLEHLDIKNIVYKEKSNDK